VLGYTRGTTGSKGDIHPCQKYPTFTILVSGSISLVYTFNDTQPTLLAYVSVVGKMSHSFQFLDHNKCTIETQKKFGPTNEDCYGGFDFTLFFEETFLSMVPFVLIFPFLLVRLYRLNKATIVVNGWKWHFAKQVCNQWFSIYFDVH
jgi:hypothetical protein